MGGWGPLPEPRLHTRVRRGHRPSVRPPRCPEEPHLCRVPRPRSARHGPLRAVPPPLRGRTDADGGALSSSPGWGRRGEAGERGSEPHSRRAKGARNCILTGKRDGQGLTRRKRLVCAHPTRVPLSAPRSFTEVAAAEFTILRAAGRVAWRSAVPCRGHGAPALLLSPARPPWCVLRGADPVASDGGLPGRE